MTFIGDQENPILFQFEWSPTSVSISISIYQFREFPNDSYIYRNYKLRKVQLFIHNSFYGNIQSMLHYSIIYYYVPKNVYKKDYMQNETLHMDFE